MKRLLQVVCLFAAACCGTAKEDEITLFDADGAAVAYIAKDDALNIYLWKGHPVAYLKKDGTDICVYGFNGQHLGWFEKGIIWSKKGKVVGFVEGAVSKLTKLEPLKGLRRLTPIKALDELPALKPTLKSEFSDCPLKAFFLQGLPDY